MQGSQQLQNKENLWKSHPRICKRCILEKSCVFGEKCAYLHKENDLTPDQIEMKERVDKLEQVA